MAKAPSPPARGWQSNGLPIWQIAVLAIVFLILYLPVLIDLAADWQADGNYSHGFLIMPIAAYLVWQKRATLRQIPLESSKGSMGRTRSGK